MLLRPANVSHQKQWKLLVFIAQQNQTDDLQPTTLLWPLDLSLIPNLVQSPL